MIDMGKKLTPKELEKLNKGIGLNRYNIIMQDLIQYEAAIASTEKSTVKERKKRSDKGNTRIKYDSSIPMNMRRYIGSANKRGIAFELSIEEFNQLCSLRCVYCDSSTKIGIDRKDSSIGYVIDNCQPCCGTCNLMKYKWDEDEFLRHILKIYKHRLR